MFYYKDSANNTYAVSSEDEAAALPPDCVQITQAEADAIRDSRRPSSLTPIQIQIAQIRKEIDDAEREKMLPHGVRVFMIGSMEKEAQEAGAARVPPLNKAQSIAALRAGNVGYRVLMEFHEFISGKEAQIAALEAQP